MLSYYHAHKSLRASASKMSCRTRPGFTPEIFNLQSGAGAVHGLGTRALPPPGAAASCQVGVHPRGLGAGCRAPGLGHSGPAASGGEGAARSSAAAQTQGVASATASETVWVPPSGKRASSSHLPAPPSPLCRRFCKARRCPEGTGLLFARKARRTHVGPCVLLGSSTWCAGRVVMTSLWNFKFHVSAKIRVWVGGWMDEWIEWWMDGWINV